VIRYCVWVSTGSLEPAPTLPPLHSYNAHWGISCDPHVERALLSRGSTLRFVTPFLPLWLAEIASRYASGAGGCGGGWRVWLARRRVRRLLAVWGRQSAWRQLDLLSYAHVPAQGELLVPERATAILGILANRQLLEHELVAAWRARALGPHAPSASDVQQLLLAGLVVRKAAVGLGSFGRFECRRCGSHESVAIVQCAVCGGECPECRDCLSLGVSRGCSALLTTASDVLAWTDARARSTSCSAPTYHLPFALSPAQESAADEIQQAMHEGVRHVLVWAACGAGKTEVVFEAIAEALARRGRVLIATPRRDVAAELCERLQSAFGAEVVAGLYGGVTQKYPDAPVLVATTHQAVRLAGQFQLLVFDECDAFPYTDSPLLQRAIARLAARAGCFVQMTATPTQRQMRQARLPGSRLIHIPARYHGYPLPVPVVCEDSRLKQWPGRQVPACLGEALVQTEEDGAQLLIFVPRRALVEPVVSAIKSVGYRRVMGVHSRSHRRDAVREALAAGALDVAVSTTVFERGLTFPTANVAVLFADAEEVFDAATLIQMAGRVGRTAQRPMGRVWFLCTRPSRQMRDACQAIEELNIMAEERGLLTACHSCP
jgi:competence protein ComFA